MEASEENMRRNELKKQLKENNIEYTKYFDLYMNNQVDREEFLKKEKEHNSIGDNIRKKLGMIHGVGDIFCQQCRKWFHPIDGRHTTIADYHTCSAHKGCIGRTDMVIGHKKAS